MKPVEAEIPLARIHTWVSSFDNPKSRHTDVVKSHWFNHELQVFIPQDVTLSTPQPGRWTFIVTNLSETFYWVKGPLHSLLHPDFISQNISSGGFTAVTLGSHIDR